MLSWQIVGVSTDAIASIRVMDDMQRVIGSPTRSYKTPSIARNGRRPVIFIFGHLPFHVFVRGWMVCDYIDTRRILRLIRARPLPVATIPGSRAARGYQWRLIVARVFSWVARMVQCYDALFIALRSMDAEPVFVRTGE